MEKYKRTWLSGIAKLLLGSLALLLILIAASRGYLPVGGGNCAIRNNIDHKIDATPLFYTESEEVVRINSGTYNFK